MTSVRPQPLALLVPLLVAGTALACPDCETARVVRASIQDDHFWTYLMMALVPFLLIGAVSALLYRVGLPRPEAAPERAPEEPPEART